MESARNDKNHQKPVVETVAQSIHNVIVAKDDGTTTCATSTVSNSDAATPTRLQAASCKTTIELCAQQESTATLMQPHHYDCELQKTMEIPAQQQRRATVTQPLQCNFPLQWHPCQSHPLQSLTAIAVTFIAVDIYCSDIHGNDIHCSDMLCSDIHCSDIHCSDIHCSDTHCSDIHCSDFQRLLTRKCRLSNFLW